MAHLIDKEVAGRVILQPAPGDDPRCKRSSYCFQRQWGDTNGDEGQCQVPPSPHRKSSDDVFEEKLLARVPSIRLARSRTVSELDAAEVLPPRSAKQHRTTSFSPSSRARLAATSNLHVEAADPLIFFEAAHRTFHLKAGHAHYAFTVDRFGGLEHLHYGAWVGTKEDLTYLSESDPALTFEPAPAGSQYSTGELMRMLSEDKIDSRQLWSLSTHMKKEEKGRDWQMSRVENISWRIRHLWNHCKQGRCDKELDVDPENAESLMKLLEKSSCSFGTSQVETPNRCTFPDLHEADGKKGRQGEKGTKLLEVSEFGIGDFRNPSLELCFRKDGSRLLPLMYRQHRILNGIVPSISGLPIAGMENPQGAQTLIIDMVDPFTELKVQLLYTVFPDISAVCRRTIVRNGSRVGMGDVELLKCMSATLDFATSDWHMVSLHGGWANERQITVRRLQEGTVDLSSRRGVSSHQMNPFCVLTSGPPSEDSGICYGINLLYSGNWIMEVEQTATGYVRVNAGINPIQFTWDLGSGEAF